MATEECNRVRRKYQHLNDIERGNYIRESKRVLAYADDLMLNYYWSPDVICNVIPNLPEWENKVAVCTKTLYNYIEQGFMRTNNIDLFQKVSRRRNSSCQPKKHKRLYGQSIEKSNRLLLTIGKRWIIGE